MSIDDSSRFGPIVPDEPAAASVWQLAQLAAKRPSGSSAEPPPPSLPACAIASSFAATDATYDAIALIAELRSSSVYSAGGNISGESGSGIGGIGKRIRFSTTSRIG